MKKMLVILMATSFAMTACQEDRPENDPDPDYILFGHFYGECGGEQCVEIYKLTGENLYEDTNDIYPVGDEAYTGNFQRLDDALFKKVKGLTSKIPDELLATTEKTIGEPDAGDWGGIYFEISIKGTVQRWTIDKMRSHLPGYLIPFVDEIEKDIELIND